MMALQSREDNLTPAEANCNLAIIDLILGSAHVRTSLRERVLEEVGVRRSRLILSTSWGIKNASFTISNTKKKTFGIKKLGPMVQLMSTFYVKSECSKDLSQRNFNRFCMKEMRHPSEGYFSAREPVCIFQSTMETKTREPNKHQQWQEVEDDHVSGIPNDDFLVTFMTSEHKISHCIKPEYCHCSK